MARRRSRSGSRRDNSTIANVPTLPFNTEVIRLTDFEDRRQFHPDGVFQSPKVLFPPRSRVVARARQGPKAQNPVRGGLVRFPSLSFSVPNKVLICVRRKQRKEVLFAKRKAGRGGQKRPRRNWYSEISC